MLILLNVRLRQFYRMCTHAGWGILLVLVVVTFGLWAPALGRLGDAGPAACAGTGALAGALIQLFRPDAAFLSNIQLHRRLVAMLDAALCLAPVAALLLLFSHWAPAVSMLAGVPVAGFLPAGALQGVLARKNRFALPFIPLQLFEWRAALRRYPAGWAAVAVLQWGSGGHLAFFVVAQLAGLVLVSAIFEYGDPKDLLPPDRATLVRKWRAYALALQLFFLPAAVLGWSLHTVNTWLVLYAVAALQTVLLLTFFYKYSVWQPHAERISGSVFTAIGLLLVLVPGGILIALPLAVWTAFKAFRTLARWWDEPTSIDHA